MNTRTIARDLPEDAPHSLSDRIARFAMAINARSAQNSVKILLETGQTGNGG